MLGDKCVWLLWMSQKFLAIDDMWLAESIKMEIMLYRKEVRHLLQESFLWNILFLSNFLIYQFPESVNNLMLALNYSLHKNFENFEYKRPCVSVYQILSFYFSFLYNLFLWDQILCSLAIQPKNHQPLKTACNWRFSSPLLPISSTRQNNRYIHHTHW